MVLAHPAGDDVPIEAPAGVTLTLDGAAVNGGFLRGAGTFALTGARHLRYLRLP